mmetsp:Transcript_64671/g.180771  ORF Transcript_64671/g.180771 Transcript_64671/m.180771 type:complete len:162 (+) Transcript_64671:100-585(+)
MAAAWTDGEGDLGEPPSYRGTPMRPHNSGSLAALRTSTEAFGFRECDTSPDPSSPVKIASQQAATRLTAEALVALQRREACRREAIETMSAESLKLLDDTSAYRLSRFLFGSDTTCSIIDAPKDCLSEGGSDVWEDALSDICSNSSVLVHISGEAIQRTSC